MGNEPAGIAASKFPPLLEIPLQETSLGLHVTKACHLLEIAARLRDLYEIFAAE